MISMAKTINVRKGAKGFQPSVKKISPIFAPATRSGLLQKLFVKKSTPVIEKVGSSASADNNHELVVSSWQELLKNAEQRKDLEDFELKDLRRELAFRRMRAK